jgi:hypothetical protein
MLCVHYRLLTNFIPTLLCAEHEDMDLSSLRARNIMRNNQFATQLGVRRLAEYIQISAKKRVATKSIGKKSKVPTLVQVNIYTSDLS